MRRPSTSMTRFCSTRIASIAVLLVGCSNRSIPDRSSAEGDIGEATGSADTLGEVTGADSANSSGADSSSRPDPVSESAGDVTDGADCSLVGELANGCPCATADDCWHSECNIAVGVCVAPGCLTGADGCRCLGTACLAGLDCVSGYCIDLACPTGSQGCSCIPKELCLDDGACVDGVCQ